MQSKKENVCLRVFKTAKVSPLKYIFGVTCSTLSIFLSGFPFLTVYVIVKISLLGSLKNTPLPFDKMLFWVTLTIISIVVGIILSAVGSFITHDSAFNALYELRMRLLAHMGKLNLGFYTGSQSGAIQKMMNENIEKMENIIAHDVSNILGAAILLLALGIFMFSINVILSLTLLFALLGAFAIQFSAFGGEKGQKIWSDLNRSSTELDASFSEYVQGMEDEKIFGQVDKSARRLTSLVEKNRKHWLSYLKRVTPIFGAYKTITISLLAFLLFAGSLLLYFNPNDHTLMMEVLLFLIVAPAFITPLMELVEFGADLRNLSSKLDQLEEVLDLPIMSEGCKELKTKDARIKFNDVSFSFQNASDPLRRMVIDHLSLDIEEQSFVALVGPSGGGKSTIGQLLARFYDVESGSITINGEDIREYSLKSLMDNIAFVFQDTHIFRASAYENISMHKDVSEEEVINAAKAAKCHDFILSLPDGYQTKLGDGGHKLSGGEEQRIAIARAILKDAPIVVLDEAMAFADAETSLSLKEGMAELLRGKTVLMIAHRLYSIQDAKCIYVIDKGRVVESGNHQKLIKEDGLYAHLYRIQNENESWVLKRGESNV